MTILGVDHLVIAVRDPDAAAADLVHELGLVFTGGGRHATAGTWNRLAFLGDAYLELIGVEDRGRVLASPAFPVGRAALAMLDAGAEGLATWAVAVDDCAAEVSRLRLGGSSIGERVPGSRIRPDGEAARWVTAFPAALGPTEPPFLIEHEMAGAEWGLDAMAERRAFEHRGLGRVRLAGLTLAVSDPAAVVRRIEDVVGIRFGADTSVSTAHIGPHLVSLRLAEPDTEPIVHLDATRSTGTSRSRSLVGIEWRVNPV